MENPFILQMNENTWETTDRRDEHLCGMREDRFALRMKCEFFRTHVLTQYVLSHVLSFAAIFSQFCEKLRKNLLRKNVHLKYLWTPLY